MTTATENEKLPSSGKPPDLAEELRARVPNWMKTAVSGMAKERMLSDADVLREAVAEYLDRRGYQKNQLGLGLT